MTMFNLLYNIFGILTMVGIAIIIYRVYLYSTRQQGGVSREL